MGEVELNRAEKQIVIYSDIYFYGDAATEELSIQIAKDIEDHWNEPKGRAKHKGEDYRVVFSIKGYWAPEMTAEMIFDNTDPRNNFFRIESFVRTDVSFVDGIGCNTGYFKLDNLLNNSTTAAHEYGHTIGLDHPAILDIRGSGQPGIMYPRGTIVDPPYQYNPAAAPLEPGGTMNPFTRKVRQPDIDGLRLDKLSFSWLGLATLGEFSSFWHEKDPG